MVAEYKVSRFKLVKDVKWAFEAKEVQTAQTKLDQAKQSLVVALSALEW